MAGPPIGLVSLPEVERAREEEPVVLDLRKRPTADVLNWGGPAGSLRHATTQSGFEQENLTLKERVGSIESQLALLQRTVFGKKSEKLPRVEDELRKASGNAPRPREATLKERRLKRANVTRRSATAHLHWEHAHGWLGLGAHLAPTAVDP
ncbi:hypothetical protein HUA76_36930 [Myxococcus sp. CA056]|uniref:hypothetical protein n=1 Tax=Myxococcus sp. CA056 TaxID=2741740 RepID=UPI00157A51E9|nr:hypothetical protein [Myxococcus sp. CA056]